MLAGGNGISEDIPAASIVSVVTLCRLVEGVRLWAKHPEARLLLSGGGKRAHVSEAEAMAKVARMLGVPEQQIDLDERSIDTEDQAKTISKLVEGHCAVLVTSAYHMSRAVGLFEKYGTTPLPAPTDFIVKTARSDRIIDFERLVPNAGALWYSARALHEYAGMAWMKLKDVSTGNAGQYPAGWH